MYIFALLPTYCVGYPWIGVALSILSVLFPPLGLFLGVVSGISLIEAANKPYTPSGNGAGGWFKVATLVSSFICFAIFLLAAGIGSLFLGFSGLVPI